METNKMEKHSIFYRINDNKLFLTSVITFLGMALLIAIVWFMKIPNPNIVLITGVIIFTSIFGRVAGAISVIMIIIYSMYFFSIDHGFLSYTDTNAHKIEVILISVIINTTIVAYLRQRWRNAQMKMVKLNAQLRRRNEKLQFLSKTDQLTGLCNRHALREDWDDYIGKQLIVALMDIDNFKLINDKLGHDAGDEALKMVSTGIKENLTNTTIYRYGGDEFLLIRNDTDVELFKKELTLVKEHLINFNNDLKDVNVYFSLGYLFGEAKTSDDIEHMIEKADDLLYEVKRHGKKDFIGAQYS